MSVDSVGRIAPQREGQERVTVRRMIDELSYYPEDEQLSLLIYDKSTGKRRLVQIDAVDTFCKDVDSQSGWSKFDDYCDTICQEALNVCETKGERAVFIASHVMNAKTRVCIASINDEESCNDTERFD